MQVSDFKKIVLSQEATKMHTFLQFAFDADNLRDNVREAWMEHYDYVYLDEKIIGGVERNLPNIIKILQLVEKRATGKVLSALSVGSKSEGDEFTDGEHSK